MIGARSRSLIRSTSLARRRLLWTPLVIVAVKVVVIFVVGLVGTMFMVWFERKVIAGMQNRIGPNKAGPFGHPADPRRRHQAVLQGGPAAGPGRPVRVPPRPVPRLRAGVPRVVGDPARRRLQRRQRRHRHLVRARDQGAARRPADRHPARARPVVDRRLRRSCSPAGRAARSTRCSARCGPRRRWSATRRRSASASPPCC